AQIGSDGSVPGSGSSGSDDGGVIVVPALDEEALLTVGVQGEGMVYLAVRAFDEFGNIGPLSAPLTTQARVRVDGADFSPASLDGATSEGGFGRETLRMPNTDPTPGQPPYLEVPAYSGSPDGNYPEASRASLTLPELDLHGRVGAYLTFAYL